MISPSLDHLPFMLGGADASVTFEQRIPLSGIRRHRRTSALTDLDRARADANRVTLDVGIQAANAYLMLQERRRTAALVNEQIAFARDVVNAANARYGSGTAPQSDVLRAEVEVARLEALARALVGEVRGAEAMLKTSLALDADTPVPPLSPVVLAQAVPGWPWIKAALASRPSPQLRSGCSRSCGRRASALTCRLERLLRSLAACGPAWCSRYWCFPLRTPCGGAIRSGSPRHCRSLTMRRLHRKVPHDSPQTR
jgi:outer membrane efflux protein